MTALASKPVLPVPGTKATDSKYNTQHPDLLVVEDNNDLLRYLVDELSENYNIFVAHNGAEALDRLGHIPHPDLIISDIMMDTMDGYQLLENTLADERFAHIPFIFLTARNNPLEKAESFEKGAFDFITKPFSIKELKTKIRAIIKQKEIISEAAVREIKKQFSETGFKTIRKEQDETFKQNILFYKVTSREKDVILCIRKGLKYEEIGDQLHISEHTVIRHVQNIYKKTGVASKIELLQKMFEIDESNSAKHQ